MAESTAIRVDLQRGSIIGVLIGLPLLLLCGGLAASIAFDGKSDMTTRIIGGFFAVIFTVPALLVLRIGSSACEFAV